MMVKSVTAALERAGFGIVISTIKMPTPAPTPAPIPTNASAANASNASNASRRLADLLELDETGLLEDGETSEVFGTEEELLERELSLATVATAEPRLAGDSVAFSIDVEALFGTTPSAVLSVCYGLEKIGSLRYAPVVREKWIFGSQEWSGIEVTSNPATYLRDSGPGKIVLVDPKAQCGYDPACYPAPAGVEVLDPIFNCSASEKIYFPIYATHAQTLKVCFCLGDGCTKKEDATLEIGTVEVTPLECVLKDHVLKLTESCREQLSGGGLVCPGSLPVIDTCRTASPTPVPSFAPTPA